MKLRPEFYKQKTETVARELLGKTLVRIANGKRLAGTIVETEAYVGVKDKASHASGGRRTPRNEALYGEGGHTYVYFIYGMYFCLNVVTKNKDEPEAVLIRAIEPTEGIEQMKNFRPNKTLTQLTSGPGKLCLAMDIDRSENLKSLQSQNIFIESAPALKPKKIARGPRIGVAYAEEWAPKKLRFWIKGNPHVSK